LLFCLETRKMLEPGLQLRQFLFSLILFIFKKTFTETENARASVVQNVLVNQFESLTKLKRKLKRK